MADAFVLPLRTGRWTLALAGGLEIVTGSVYVKNALVVPFLPSRDLSHLLDGQFLALKRYEA